MPSHTVYLKEQQTSHLDEIVEKSDMIDNRSQAIQYLINKDAQNKEKGEFKQ